MRYLSVTSIVATLLSIQPTSIDAQLPVDTLNMKSQTYFLAHDLLGGRATGTPGAELAAEYIASECRSLGLVPAGRTLLQPVPLEEATIEAGTILTVSRLDRQASFAYPDDFTPNVGTRATLVGFSGPAVYVGLASELDSRPTSDIDLEGAVAVVAGARISTETVDLIREAGASGIIQLIPDEQSYSMYRNSRGTTRLYHEDSSIRSSFLPSLPSLLAGPELSALLVANALRGARIQRGPLGLNVRFEIEKTTRTISGANVACLLPGNGTMERDTTIVFTAHYDHLGVTQEPDTAGDNIYNGFADNAVGVAMLLGIAGAMASDFDSPVSHSMLFLFPVGEERGLLGSDYWVSRPYWPLERTLAVINIDAGAPPGLLENWSLSGVDSTGLGGIAIEIAQERGWNVTTSPPVANSDYYPFVREGVPGVFVKPGPGPYEGLSADSSDALRHRWRYYHHPKDEWTEDFPYSGLQRYAEFAYLIAREVDKRPRW